MDLAYTRFNNFRAYQNCIICKNKDKGLLKTVLIR